jgi:hypothetical protein
VIYMADDKELKRNIQKAQKPLNRLNNAFTSMISRMTDSGSDRDLELERLIDDVDRVVQGELEYMKNYTGSADIGTYLVKLMNDQNDNRYTPPVKTIEDIFGNDTGSVFSMFHERHKNLNILYDDLEMICSELYELMEAINATRDAIVTSDDISQKVSRTINIKGKGHGESEREGTRSIVEAMENRFNLLGKIKDHIVPKSLQYGVYYAYTVPYSELFKQHYIAKKKEEMKYGNALESMNDEEIKSLLESFDITSRVDKTISKNINSILENIEVCTDGEIAIPVMENAEFGAFMEDKFQQQVQKTTREQERKAKRTKMGVDGTLDVNGKEADFSNIKDCYFKLIPPSKLIPIKIMDEVMGYYYIHKEDLDVSKTPFSNTISINSKQKSDEDIETGFLSKITDRIVKAFDKKYLEDNVEFKKLIMNALIYNDVYKKKIRFQFIPRDYITAFHINPDVDGEGRSVLAPSLFYAKLYLALLIFNMVSIVSNSNDTRIYYLKNSGLDTDVTTQTQKTAMDIKRRQMNFNDLMSHNMTMTKVGQARSIFMPVGRTGDKAIDFDVIAGQTVEVNSELMTMLRTGAINATGVPSVITEHINDVDYARTLVMANAKFLANAVSRQLEFNPAITEMYRKMLRFTTDLDEDEINDIEFVLARPKALTSANLSDLISSSNQIIDYMVKVAVGDNATPSDDDNKLKDIVVKKLSQELMPMLPWDVMESIIKSARIEVVQVNIAKAETTGGDV